MSNEKKRLLELSELLRYHDNLYYNESNPELSDLEYDALRIEFNELLKSVPNFRPEAADTVGAEATGLKIQHLKPMLSLDNAFEQDDLVAFYKRIAKLLNVDSFIPLVAELKIDGLSAAFRYQNGKLKTIATRGNGREGEDVTHNLSLIKGIPRSISLQEEVEIRGELYLTLDSFKTLNKLRVDSGASEFSNPRNAASGLVRLLKHTLPESLNFFAYDFVADSVNLNSQEHRLHFLEDLGFSVNPKRMLISSLTDANTFYETIQKERNSLEYEIDGIVLKVNDLTLQQELGYVSRSPRYAIAYKFSPEQAETILENIDIQVGRTGVLTPVAILKPTIVGGVCVSRATLHNEDEINRLRIQIGDRVLIQRAGDVIPKIVESMSARGRSTFTPFEFPSVCHVCHSPVIQKEGEVAKKCSGGMNCDAQKLGFLKYFVSKKALNITGLGDRSIEFFYELGWIRHPHDIFRLASKRTELETLEGWGKDSVNNLFDSIEKARNVSFPTFLYALGIDQVGETVAKLVAAKFESMDSLLTAFQDHSLESTLLEIDGVGPIIASCMLEFFAKEENMVWILEIIRDLFISLLVTSDRTTLPFYGKTIVFTGTLSMNRTDAQKQAEKLGFKIVNSVSKKTDYVVAGENAGSKLDTAKKLGVRVLSEKDWSELISPYI